MKRLVILVICLMAFLVSCKTAEIDPYNVPVRHTYIIHAYTPAKDEMNHKNFNVPRTSSFLDTIINDYKDGDIIAVDGLKWQKVEYAKRPGNGELMATWEPYPNPPVSIYEKDKESAREHVEEYAQWINDHPHFQLPPLPMMN